MSEHNQGANNNRISNIAHFFLSDLSDSNVSGSEDISHPYPPTPQRTDQPEMTDPSYFLKYVGGNGNGNGKAIELIGVVCSHLKWQAMGALREYARYLAGEGRKVAVLNLQSWAAQLNIYRKDISCDKEEEKREEYFEEPIKSFQRDKGENGRKVDILECLDEYSRSIDCLLLMFGPEFNNYSRDLFSSLDCVCVITNTRREQIISAYQVIKGISNNNVRVGVFVVEADSEESAMNVYSRLSKTSEEHIKKELCYLGCSISERPVVSEMIAREQLRTDSLQSTEEWIARLRRWLDKHKSEDTEVADEKEIHKRESLSDKIESGGNGEGNLVGAKKPLRNAEKNILKVAELIGEEKRFLALQIGKKLLGREYKAEGSDLIDFLRECGLCCARFLSKENDKSCFVLVFEEGQNREISDWLLNGYPHKSDELIIVSDVQFGYLETHRWRDKFPNLRIVPMLKGSFEGENVIILSY